MINMNKIKFWLKRQWWKRFPKNNSPYDRVGTSIRLMSRLKRPLCILLGHDEVGVYSWISYCERCQRSFNPIPDDQNPDDGTDYWGSYGINKEEMGLVIETDKGCEII